MGRLNFVKMSVLHKEIYGYNATAVKILTVFFAEMEN